MPRRALPLLVLAFALLALPPGLAQEGGPPVPVEVAPLAVAVRAGPVAEFALAFPAAPEARAFRLAADAPFPGARVEPADLALAAGENGTARLLVPTADAPAGLHIVRVRDATHGDLAAVEVRVAPAAATPAGLALVSVRVDGANATLRVRNLGADPVAVAHRVLDPLGEVAASTRSTVVQPGEEKDHEARDLHARAGPRDDDHNVTVEVFDQAAPELALRARVELPPPRSDVPPALLDAFSVDVTPPEALRVPSGGAGRGEALVTNRGARTVTVHFPRAPFFDAPEGLALLAHGRPASVTLAPDASATVQLLVEDAGESPPFEGRLSYAYEVEGADGRETMLVEVPVRVARGTPLDVAAEHPVAVTLALGGGAALLTVPLLRRENVRYLALAALYARLRAPRVLEHADRERLVALIRARPGIRYAALQRETGLATGALVHHLRTLERHKVVRSRRDGSRRVFFASDAPPAATAELSPVQARILEMARAGDLTQREMGERLGISQQAVSQHLRELERRGLR